jgi:hypothetical protein
MNLSFWIDDRVVAMARKKARALGKSLDELIRDYLRTFADDNPEKSVAEFKRLSARGNSNGWRFDRDEIHNRKSRRSITRNQSISFR